MDKESIKETASQAFDKKTYENTINKLNAEKERLERDLRKEYRNARKYVRSHPEQGVLVSLIGGFVVGFIVSKLID
jgi:ElaB/YqjD/DUF883 family membrane-anchored ribosome-binding protein